MKPSFLDEVVRVVVVFVLRWLCRRVWIVVVIVMVVARCGSRIYTTNCLMGRFFAIGNSAVVLCWSVMVVTVVSSRLVLRMLSLMVPSHSLLR